MPLSGKYRSTVSARLLFCPSAAIFPLSGDCGSSKCRSAVNGAERVSIEFNPLFFLFFFEFFLFFSAAFTSGGSFEGVRVASSTSPRAFVHQVVFRAQGRARFRGKLSRVLCLQYFFLCFPVVFA
ncbi:hypothetical protein LR48_Vigan07g148000 [Vigna angularis]|uniref:Transmembrane protein n=1 Tax=Phaseolus angularis TaxID=3914 RepID=A0A0L9UYK2_PHAAN|nr:hypothetical protein LR48_Vigan07g148000 [Vigna angularis]